MGALFAFVAVTTVVVGLRDLTFPTLEQREIGVDGVGDFAYAYVFVGRVGAGGVAGTQLERGPCHERLVAQRGRAKGRHSQ